MPTSVQCLVTITIITVPITVIWANWKYIAFLTFLGRKEYLHKFYAQTNNLPKLKVPTTLWFTLFDAKFLHFPSLSEFCGLRYHLAAAGCVLDKLEEKLLQHPDLGKAQADLARCWIHYGLHLFGMSKKVILERMCNEDMLPMGKLLFFYLYLPIIYYV